MPRPCVGLSSFPISKVNPDSLQEVVAPGGSKLVKGANCSPTAAPPRSTWRVIPPSRSRTCPSDSRLSGAPSRAILALRESTVALYSAAGKLALCVALAR